MGVWGAVRESPENAQHLVSEIHRCGFSFHHNRPCLVAIPHTFLVFHFSLSNDKDRRSKGIRWSYLDVVQSDMLKATKDPKMWRARNMTISPISFQRYSLLLFKWIV